MPERISPRLSAIALALVPFVALGLARFAYGLLLPPMKEDLGWSYTAAGLVTTANAVGYLAGAALASRAIRLLGTRSALLNSVWLVGLSLLLNGLTNKYGLILGARLAAGLFGGIGFVAGGVVATEISASGVRFALLAYPAGAGAAIALTAFAVPAVVGQPSEWSLGWFLLSGMALVSVLILAATVPTSTAGPPLLPTADSPRLRRPEAAYGLFGLGYIAYVTFAVAYLRDGGASDGSITVFWLAIGLASLGATLAWVRFDVAGRGRTALAASLGICGVGALLLVLGRSTAFVLLSAVLYGGSFLAVVTSVTQVVRDELLAPAWPRAISRFTIIFGIGQILGPVVAGLLGDSPVGLRLGLGLSAAALLGASLIARFSVPPTS